MLWEEGPSLVLSSLRRGKENYFAVKMALAYLTCRYYWVLTLVLAVFFSCIFSEAKTSVCITLVASRWKTALSIAASSAAHLSSLSGFVWVEDLLRRTLTGRAPQSRWFRGKGCFWFVPPRYGPGGVSYLTFATTAPNDVTQRRAARNGGGCVVRRIFSLTHICRHDAAATAANVAKFLEAPLRLAMGQTISKCCWPNICKLGIQSVGLPSVVLRLLRQKIALRQPLI